jgi:hypothetical protein
MGFYGNITNTSKTQFQFDLIYPSKYKMTQMCPKDGVYIGRYVLVDYDADPNNVIKEGFRKGNLIDFPNGGFLYSSKNCEENFKITYYQDEYWDYDWSSTDVINGVIGYYASGGRSYVNGDTAYFASAATIDIKTEHTEKFTHDGKEYTNDFLKNHATALFSDIIKAAAVNEKDKFLAVVEAIGLGAEKASKIWIVAKPVLKWLDKLTVKKAARIMNFITFGKAIDKKAAKEIADVKVTDMVFGAFCSILDGSLVKHEEGSAYYTVFTQALALPLKIVKKLRIKNGGLIRTLTHIKDAAPELMTGGPLDNNNWFCEF